MIDLRLGDCLEVMKQIPDKSVDAIICDLPYGTTACKWDSVIPFEPLWEQYKRVIKDNGAIALTASQPFTSALVMSNAKWFKYEWVWEKSKGSNFIHSNYQPLKTHENIVIFGKNGSAQGSKNPIKYFAQKTIGKPYDKGIGTNKTEILNGGMTKQNTIKLKNTDGFRHPRSVQYFKTAENEGKLHPTQKPVALMEYLVKTYTSEGDTVLDNCMGSGTTGVACKNLNRHFIGIEQDANYFEIAKGRING